MTWMGDVCGRTGHIESCLDCGRSGRIHIEIGSNMLCVACTGRRNRIKDAERQANELAEDEARYGAWGDDE